MKKALPIMALLCVMCWGFATSCSDEMEQQLERFEEMNRTDVPMTPDSVQPLVRHYDHWWSSHPDYAGFKPSQDDISCRGLVWNI